MLGNPMGIGPTWQGNYVQPGTPTTSGQSGTAAGNPAPNPQVAPVGALNLNVLAIVGPQPAHVDAGPGSWAWSD
jgi:hypothetical protein